MLIITKRDLNMSVAMIQDIVERNCGHEVFFWKDKWINRKYWSGF